MGGYREDIEGLRISLMPIVKEKFTDIWKRREPLYLKEKKIHRMILT